MDFSRIGDLFFVSFFKLFFSTRGGMFRNCIRCSYICKFSSQKPSTMVFHCSMVDSNLKRHDFLDGNRRSKPLISSWSSRIRFLSPFVLLLAVLQFQSPFFGGHTRVVIAFSASSPSVTSPFSKNPPNVPFYRPPPWMLPLRIPILKQPPEMWHWNSPPNGWSR